MPQAIRSASNTIHYTPAQAKWRDDTIIFREFLKTLDDQEWQSSLFTLLQNQTFNQVSVKCGLVPGNCNSYFIFQVEVDLFELMCKVLDQNLFAQVDWARNSYYFKELKVGLSDDLNSFVYL